MIVMPRSGKAPGSRFVNNVHIIRRRHEKSSKEKPLNIFQIYVAASKGMRLMLERIKFAVRCTF